MKKLIYLFIGLLVFSSCKKEWLDVDPSGSVPAETSIQSLYDAEVALNGVYSSMQDNNYYGADMISYGEVKGDDMRTYAPGKRTYSLYMFESTTDAGPTGLWYQPYVTIALANNILANIDGLEISDTEQVSANNIKGQALTLRALAHFDLARLHGAPFKKDNGASLGVPNVTELLDATATPSRNTVAQNYELVISDLEAAIDILAADKNDGQINVWSAKALLSRVLLYKGDDAEALSIAEDVIANSPYTLLTTANFLESWSTGFSTESLFELVNTDNDNADREAIGYLINPDGYGAVTLTDSFISMLGENTADVRNGLLGVDSRSEDERKGYLLKYPGRDGSDTRVNNVKIIRLSEVYLNAAEAAMKLGDATKAASLLSTLVENRTGETDAFDAASVSLTEIMNERRKELVGEGHRYFDVIRDGNELVRTSEDHVDNAPTGINWSDYRTILPIPRSELNVNPNIKQNTGYQG
jgi:hypothetical protein